jgi:hypothetical protein
VYRFTTFFSVALDLVDTDEAVPFEELGDREETAERLGVEELLTPWSEDLSLAGVAVLREEEVLFSGAALEPLGAYRGTDWEVSPCLSVELFAPREDLSRAETSGWPLLEDLSADSLDKVEP